MMEFGKSWKPSRSIPVIGNGDVTNIADADFMLKATGCAGVSIGRGALANPWIFRQLVQWEQTGECDPPVILMIGWNCCYGSFVICWR